MSSFCFIVTQKCNWNCSYCEFPKISDPKETTVEILSRHLPYIKNVMNRLGNLVVFSDISGGEVGLLPLDTLRYFFQTLDYPMVVSTNGKFMENGYHLDKILRPYIKGLWYHVHPEPGKFKVSYNYQDDEILINKGIVHNNINDIIDFINLNRNIEFGYIELEFDIDKKMKPNYEMYLDLYNRIKDLPNVTNDARHIIHQRLNEKLSLRDDCQNLNTTVVLDMINERILLCHRSQMNYIKLNEKNLINRLTNFPRDLFKGSNKCESCTRLFAGKFSGGGIIETFFKTRRLLNEN